MCLYKQIVLAPTAVLSASEEWNGSKRVDLRFWETDTFPTKYGVILSLSQWKILCSATQVVDDLISREKDGEPVNWRYHLGEDVYVIIKAPQLTNHTADGTNTICLHRHVNITFIPTPPRRLIQLMGLILFVCIDTSI
jgi:hypothetical protein